MGFLVTITTSLSKQIAELESRLEDGVNLIDDAKTEVLPSIGPTEKCMDHPFAPRSQLKVG